MSFKDSKWFRLISMVIVIGLVFSNGILAGWYLGTGSLPQIGQSVSTLPPDITNRSLTEVSDMLKEDKTNELPYGEGWNCVDYAWTVMRSLSWQGINSAIIGLHYEDGTRHALLAIPTTDSGWVAIDPQSDGKVNPTVGGYYNGKRVARIEVLIMQWVDIEEFKDGPTFGIKGE